MEEFHIDDAQLAHQLDPIARSPFNNSKDVRFAYFPCLSVYIHASSITEPCYIHEQKGAFTASIISF